MVWWRIVKTVQEAKDIAMVYRFGSCELDAARLELRRNGQAVPVEPQVLELLLYLIAHRDRAVTRAELFEKLWRGRVVSDSALNSRIKAARAAIGDDGAAQEQIRTLHRTGYRFVGSVAELTDDAALPETSDQPTTAPAPSASSPPVGRHGLWLASAAVGLALAVGGFAVLPRDAREGVESAAVTVAASPAPAPAVSEPQSLAVLPFANLSADPEQDYFADGIGVELMKVLSHLPDLRVTGRSSSLHFEGRNETPHAVGSQLGVAHVLTGSVQKSGERVRITVALDEAQSGYRLWAESYDRELGDLFDVQDDIAARVATALKVKLGLGESGELGMTRNVEAYDEFLRGYAAYNEHTSEAFQRAVLHMQRAIALDPTFSRASAYLYCIYLDGANVLPERTAEWTRKAVEALSHARALTPDSPFVRVLEAREYMRLSRRLDALATIESLPTGYWTADRFVTRDAFLARMLITTGHAEQAIEVLERARAADPLSPVVSLLRSLAYAGSGHSSQALAEVDFGLELGGLRPTMQGHALLVALGTDDTDEIRRRAAAAPQNPDGRRPITDELLPLLDDPDRARAELRRLAAEPAPPNYLRGVLLAYWAAHFGDTELALAQLGTSVYGAPDDGLLWRPVLADVRRLPGFKELLRREGLVDYWRVAGWPNSCQPTTADDFECS
jgi:TolB-like protein/DNA-binding winged helix-turn-helix (wHTH) protein